MTSNSPIKREQRALGVSEASFGPTLPMRFALSRLPPTKQNVNNNGMQRFRPLAKLSTVSLVGR